MKPINKFLLPVIISFLFASSVHAQFKKATLQASGLTCAMCTRAINNSLEKLPFVASVEPDIKNSSFNVVFKQGVNMNIDQLKSAVEDAGFSVAKLRLSANFDNVAVKDNEHVQVNGNTFHFLKVKNQTLKGDREIVVVDKHFLPSKDFKKYSAATEMKCVQTGKTASCCTKEGISADTRVYHVTI